MTCRYVVTSLLLALIGCQAPKPPAFEVFGSLHAAMAEGAPSAVTLDRVSTREALGVGALSELRGEITLVDGQLWLAYPQLPSGLVVTKESSPESAALLIIARPNRWTDAMVERDVSAAELESYLAETVGRSALDSSRPIAIKVEGKLLDVSWHIVDGSRIAAGANGHAAHAAAGIQRTAETLEGILVGFYATSQQGVVTHAGARTHLHLVVTGTERTSGHVDAVGLAQGGRIRLGQ